MMPDLIYCASGNERFAKIAMAHGFLYGAQLPATVNIPLYFADQDWRAPDREKYMRDLERYRPHMATVLDWERHEQLMEVLEWAEEAAQYIDTVIIIPKVQMGIELLPRKIGGKEVRLGYSVPTKYAGSPVNYHEFLGWPVHLLGGSPHAQMGLTRYLNVVSADGNYINKMATRYCRFWTDGNAHYAKNRWFPTLAEAGMRQEHDAPYVAFEKSCENIMRAWSNLNNHDALPLFRMT